MVIDLRTEGGYSKYTDLMSKSSLVIGKYFDVPSNQVLITCGATGALNAIFSHFQKNTVAIMPFEYFDIFTFANLHQCALLTSQPDNHQRNDVKAFCQLIRKKKPQIIYLSVPNNPLGQEYSTSDLQAILQSLSNDQVCVFDQTLLSTHPIPAGFFRKYGKGKKIIVVGSFSKSHNLVNERIGYLFMPVEKIAFHPYAYAPAAFSLKKMMRVLNDDTYSQKVLRMIKQNNDLIVKWAQSHPEFVWFKTMTNFGVLYVKENSLHTLAKKLVEKNVLIKNNKDLHCPGKFIRVHLGASTNKMKKFLAILEKSIT